MNSEVWAEFDIIRDLVRRQGQTIHSLTERVQQLEQLSYAQSVLIAELQQATNRLLDWHPLHIAIEAEDGIVPVTVGGVLQTQVR